MLGPYIKSRRDYVRGGLCPGGFCPGGFCPGGFCPGGFLSYIASFSFTAYWILRRKLISLRRRVYLLVYCSGTKRNGCILQLYGSLRNVHFITVFSGLYANVTEVRIKQLCFYILYFIVLSIILTILFIIIQRIQFSYIFIHISIMQYMWNAKCNYITLK